MGRLGGVGLARLKELTDAAQAYHHHRRLQLYAVAAEKAEAMLHDLDLTPKELQHVVTSLAIAHDKTRLESGEATSRHENAHVHIKLGHMILDTYLYLAWPTTDHASREKVSVGGRKIGPAGVLQASFFCHGNDTYVSSIMWLGLVHIYVPQSPRLARVVDVTPPALPEGQH